MSAKSSFHCNTIRWEVIVFFTGKNCEQDIPECEGIAESPGNPCLHGALCFERSDVSLYQNESFALLPEDVKDSFSRPFAHKNAGGYVCRSGHKLSCSVGFFKKSVICLEGKRPLIGWKIVFFCSFQQLMRLGLEPLRGFLSSAGSLAFKGLYHVKRHRTLSSVFQVRERS